jgi:hypothetical protein
MDVYLEEYFTYALAALSASNAKLRAPSGETVMEHPTRNQIKSRIRSNEVIFTKVYLRSPLLNKFQQRKQANNYSDCQRCHPHSPFKLLLE